jgi:hypothetical protein
MRTPSDWCRLRMRHPPASRARRTSNGTTDLPCDGHQAQAREVEHDEARWSTAQRGEVWVRWSKTQRRGEVEQDVAMAELAPSRTASACTGAGRPGQLIDTSAASSISVCAPTAIRSPSSCPSAGAKACPPSVNTKIW